jgi:AcrR family transcriptional regulator
MAEMTEGRTNQKARTRRAILEACQDLVGSGAEPTMPAVARLALVSEATAYRYFPDLISLLSEAMRGLWPDPAEMLAPVAGNDDPVERVGYAARCLAEHVLAHQGAARAMIAGTVSRPGTTSLRPGIRFALIDLALGPKSTKALSRLKAELAAVLSPEALFAVIDGRGMDSKDAIDVIEGAARTLTRAALGR